MISHRLTAADRWGGFKARWGIGRLHYTVESGLYALGKPGVDSVVLATANYKLSFDALRTAVAGLDAWILVLDTRGINVWCAAGKGTFGTEELVERIGLSNLSQVVDHRRIILPQLGAPGIVAREIKKRTGFKASFGPIRATDLIPFLKAGRKATPEMRLKSFTLTERTVLIPIELVTALKYLILILPAFWILNGFIGPDAFWRNLTGSMGVTAAALLGAVFAGTVLTPILLPWLPGRAFSVKGAVAGCLVFLLFWIYFMPSIHTWYQWLEALGWFFMMTALSAFLGMNFTGSSSYTSLSGVRKEMKIALPAEIGMAASGLFLWIGSWYMR